MNNIKEIIKYLGAIVVVPVGLAEVIVTFFPFEFEPVHRTYLLIVLISCGVIISYLTRKKAGLVAPMHTGSKYKLIFPCGDKEYEEANKLAKKAFGKRNAIPLEQIKDWRSKNNELLSILVDSSFELRGYFDLFPLNKEFYDGFKNGELTEKDISSSSILSPSETCEYLYLGGITSTDNNPIIGSVLLTSVILKIKHLYNKPLIFSATAASEDGEHYLQNFQFNLVKGKQFRNDDLNFYERTISPDEINKLIEDMGRKSKYLDYTCYINHSNRSEIQKLKN